MQRISVAMMAGAAPVLIMVSCTGERDMFVTLELEEVGSADGS